MPSLPGARPCCQLKQFRNYCGLKKIAILEEQSDEECAHLLRCSQRDVTIARLVALKRHSNTDALAGEMLQS
jgi:hypothetical protein